MNGVRHGSAALAIVFQRCPRCRNGRVFRRLLAMHEHCPVCGLQFEPEPGYFVGAMYVSYALAVPIYALMIITLHVTFPGWSDLRLLLVSLPLFLPCAPAIVRYSRLIWLHFDWRFHPRS